MKTIFIPIFQGAEARSILRTDIFSVLQKKNEVRIILLVLDEYKRDYFQKEFFGENIIYEVVKKKLSPKLDFIFIFLKDNVINTWTRRNKLRMDYKSNSGAKGIIIYIFKLFLHYFLGNYFFRKMIRWLDFKLVKDYNFNALFEKYNPELVFLAHIFGNEECSILRQAKKRGLKSIGFINSWDKTTSRGMVRILPDELIVHNDIIKKEVIRHMDIEERNVFVSGIPQYDVYFDYFKSKSNSVDNGFFEKMNLNPGKKILLFCPIGAHHSKSDHAILKIIDDLVGESKELAGTQILVRFPPNDNVNLKKEEYKNSVFFQPGKRFSNKRGIDWDMDHVDIDILLKTLVHSKLVICSASSMSIDAAIFNIPIINVCLKEIEDTSWFYELEHYKKLLDCKGIRIAKNKNELFYWMKNYLKNPKLDQDGREKIVKTQCFNLYGDSGKKIANFLLKSLETNDRS